MRRFLFINLFRYYIRIISLKVSLLSIVIEYSLVENAIRVQIVIPRIAIDEYSSETKAQISILIFFYLFFRNSSKRKLKK